MLHKGQSGCAGQAKAIEKESIERFAKLTRGEREASLLAQASSKSATRNLSLATVSKIEILARIMPR